MKRKLLITASLAISLLTAVAQNPTNGRIRCYSTEHAEWLNSQDPNLKMQSENDAKKFQEWSQSRAALRTNSTNTIITIPVVVHVVYSNTTQNLSTAQILSQIDVLNEDFAKMNADTVNIPAVFRPDASATQFQFCLAKQDPTGAMTDGIERRQTTVTSFSTNNNVKHYSSGGLNAWDVNRYMNIWVCNMGNGILGYAQFPTTVHSNNYGVVIQYDSFGRIGTVSAPYDLGRTLSHEIGHCFNLIHIWGDDGNACSGSDSIADTPNQASETYGCNTFPKYDACSGSSTNGIMFMDYMDYGDDNCLIMFTRQQSTRMLDALTLFYPTLITSTGCQEVVNNINSPSALQFSVYPNPTDGILNIEMFANKVLGDKLNVQITDIIGKIVFEQEIGQSNGQTYQVDMSAFENGSYFATVYNQSYKKTVKFVLNR